MNLFVNNNRVVQSLESGSELLVWWLRLYSDKGQFDFAATSKRRGKKRNCPLQLSSPANPSGGSHFFPRLPLLLFPLFWPCSLYLSSRRNTCAFKEIKFSKYFKKDSNEG